MLHGEKIPSAIERYGNEVRRVLGVLEECLARNGTGWLVGDKCTYADLVFMPYNDRVEWFYDAPPEDKFHGFPRVREWHERMTARPAWKRSMELRARLMDEQGLGANGMPKGVSITSLFFYYGRKERFLWRGLC